MEQSLQKEKEDRTSSSSFASRSTSDLAQSVFQPLPKLPYTPKIGYQPLSIPPNQTSSLFHPPHYQKLTPPQPSPYHNLIAPPSPMLYPKPQHSPKPAPKQTPSPIPDPVTGASSHQPPNLFPIEPFNPLTSLLHQLATQTLSTTELPPSSPTSSVTSSLDNLMMMEKDEPPEPQVTEPMDEETSSSIPVPPPPSPNMDQNRLFTLEDIPLQMERKTP